MLRFASEPVLSVRVTLAVSADPAVSRPAVAQATVDPNRRIVRAQAAGETMQATAAHMAARLRVRLDRSARDWAARRGTLPVAEPGEWRHQSIPAHRPAYFPGPADARAVIRQPCYASRPLTPEEAVAELDLLDYDFPPVHRAVDGGAQRAVPRGRPVPGSLRYDRGQIALASCPRR